MSVAKGFEFPVDNSDGWDGFNHPGIEHFAGSPFTALGREVPQNVLDATKETPARVVIRLVDIHATEFPHKEQLLAVLKRCAKAAVNESPKAKTFFDNAIAILGKTKIPVLQIADYSTTGVVGPCTNGTPYFALMKASGQSKKHSEEAIGSFGIGKYAPFTVSGLRTIFVSTVWASENGWQHYAQGKSILMSHPGSDKKTRVGIGYWGKKDGCAPVIGLDRDLPKWLQRAKSEASLSKFAGTTISVAGFAAVKGWQQVLAASIIENFFGAIAKKKLVVDVNGTYAIDDQTLPEMFADAQIRGALLEMKGEPDRFDHSALYSKALSSTETIVEQTENQHLGKCELRILVGENLPKKVAVLRDGMLITDELDGLKRFGEFKEFVAVLECQSKKGNALLRAMEPPRHDDFEHERLPEQDKRKGKTALKEIATWVRSMLKRYAQDPVSEVTNIDELKDLFADETDSDENKKDGEENPAGKIVIRARPISRKSHTPAYENSRAASGESDLDDGDDEGGEAEGAASGGSEETASGESEGSNGGNSGGLTDGNHASQGSGGNSGSGGEEAVGTGRKRAEKNSPAKVQLRDVRSIPTGGRTRRIAFTPEFTGEISISLDDSGADANYPLRVIATDLGQPLGGLVTALTVKAGKRVVLNVELDGDFDGAMRVSADAI